MMSNVLMQGAITLPTFGIPTMPVFSAKVTTELLQLQQCSLPLSWGYTAHGQKAAEAKSCSNHLRFLRCRQLCPCKLGSGAKKEDLS